MKTRHISKITKRDLSQLYAVYEHLCRFEDRIAYSEYDYDMELGNGSFLTLLGSSRAALECIMQEIPFNDYE